MVEKAIEGRNITLEAAKRIVTAAKEKALEIEVPMCISVCDASGQEVLYERMDEAHLVAVEASKNKARTAVKFKMPTHEWFDVIKDDPPLLHGIPPISGLLILGGGYPLYVDDTLCGAIGTSGGHYTEDMEVARAGVEVFQSL